MTTHSAFEIPDHVSPELVRDFDYLSGEIEGDVFEWWAQAFAHGDIFYTPRHGGHWVVTREADIGHVLATYPEFSSRNVMVPKGGHELRLAPLEFDPPEQVEYRRLVVPFFSHKAISDLEPDIRRLCASLIEGVYPDGSCEFVSQIALALPIHIFLKMVDLPSSDRLELLSCAEDISRGTAETHIQGITRLGAYLARIFAERRNSPGDDLLSAMIQGEVGGRRMTEPELTGMGLVVVAAGLDTVAAAMSFITAFLAQNPNHRRRLIAEPALIPEAVEELLRRHSVSNIAREVVNDITFRGVFMKAGDMVVAPTTLAGLDDRRFERPLEVDFDRPDKRSLVFGRGPHHCIGFNLARAELRIFLEMWLSRIPDFAIAPGDAPRMSSGRDNGVHHLPVVWPVAKD